MALKRTAVMPIPVVDRRKFTIKRAITAKTAIVRYTRARSPAANFGGKTGVPVPSLKKIARLNTTFSTSSPKSASPSHVEIAHPDGEPSDDEAEGHCNKAAMSTESRMGIRDRRSEVRCHPTCPGEGRLAEPDHTALTGHQTERQEDDGIGDSLAHQPEPEAMQEQRQRQQPANANADGFQLRVPNPVLPAAGDGSPPPCGCNCSSKAHRRLELVDRP